MRVDVFMAGTPAYPQTARSALVARLLDICGIEAHVTDVTGDDSLRDSLITETGFDLFPHVYVDEEFIGGGEVLVELLKSAHVYPNEPKH